MNSAVIRISTERMIEMASAEVEQDRRQRQDQDHQDGHHADRKRDVAPLGEVAETEAREGEPARLSCGDVGH